MTRNKKLVKMMALAVAASTVATSVPAYAAFDATYYAQQNPDVVAAIGTKPADLEMHYNVFGKKEGRAGSADEIGGSALRQLFDAEYYAKLNPDVVAVYGNDANALFSHFLQFGIKEGRKINPYFDVNAYKKAYPDLVAAFGDDIAAYYNHFATNGIKEHRTLGGFPAEKIVPGGVAVASSGGSSSSSGGGGGSSSKPAPKPAEEQVTPTPDPTPAPQPEPEPEPEPESNNKQTAAESIDVIKAAKAITVSNNELKAEIADYYTGTTQNATPITKGECAVLVSRALANLNDAEAVKNTAETNLEIADEELKAAQKALDDANAAVSEAAKTNSALATFGKNASVVNNVATELGKYYVALDDLAAAQADVEEKAAIVESKKAEADVAQKAYDKAFENVKTTYFAIADKNEKDIKDKTDEEVVDLLAGVAGAVETSADKITNANNKVKTYLEPSVTQTKFLYDVTTRRYSTSVYNQTVRAINEDVEKNVLSAAQLAYLNSLRLKLKYTTNDYDPTLTEADADAKAAATKLGTYGVDVTTLKQDTPIASLGTLNVKSLSAESEELSKLVFASSDGYAYTYGTGLDNVLTVGDKIADKSLATIIADTKKAEVASVDTVVNEYKATLAGEEYADAKQDKDDADDALELAQDNKTDADEVLNDKELAVQDAQEAVADAKDIRDEAYEAAGVAGNEELIARDEAQEEFARESYEDAKAAAANNNAKTAYDAAVDNYASSSKLVEKP